MTPTQPSQAQITAGLMALLQCTQTELGDYSEKLMSGYEDDVRRVYLAMTGKEPRAELTRPQEVAAVGDGILAYLDELKDEAAAHIYPDDLHKCASSECVVEVFSVRVGNSDGEKSVPLFSRAQVVEAIAANRVPVALPAEPGLRDAVSMVCEGWTLPDGVRKILETALWATPTPKQGDAKDARPDSFHSDSGDRDRVQGPGPTDAELTLRRLLCLTFSRGLAYTDDGELSDSQRHPSIDFLRDAPADIEAKMTQRNADTLFAPVQTVLCEHSGCGSNTQVDSLSVKLNPGDKVVLLKGRMTQEFDRADAAILASKPTAGEVGA